MLYIKSVTLQVNKVEEMFIDIPTSLEFWLSGDKGGEATERKRLTIKYKKLRYNIFNVQLTSDW